MTLRALVLILASISACQAEDITETVTTWRLTHVGSAPYAARATLTLTANGISGRAPCNSFGASQTATLPSLKIGPIRSTRAACPDLAAEQTYLRALGKMTQAIQTGDTLTLSDESGLRLVFATP